VLEFGVAYPSTLEGVTPPSANYFYAKSIFLLSIKLVLTGVFPLNGDESLLVSAVYFYIYSLSSS
jgi:hypothetical protein